MPNQERQDARHFRRRTVCKIKTGVDYSGYQSKTELDVTRILSMSLMFIGGHERARCHSSTMAIASLVALH